MGRTDVAGFARDSGRFDPVFSSAFFVEVAAVDVVCDRDGEVLHLHIFVLRPFRVVAHEAKASHYITAPSP